MRTSQPRAFALSRLGDTSGTHVLEEAAVAGEGDAALAVCG